MARFAKNLVALGLGFGLIALIEAVLALSGLRPLSEEDPFVGFEGSRPTFVASPEDPGLYRLDPAKEQYFNAQSFRHPKPPGVFRIVAFGGSTTYGHPYLHRTSFPAWTARLLGLADPGKTYEVINAGGISYASYRVRRLAEELARFEPDLYVVYSGHNEFLERRNFAAILAEPPALRRTRSLLHRSRLYTAVYRGVRALRGAGASSSHTVLTDRLAATLEEVGGPELYHRDETFRQGVIEQYRASVEAIARFARGRGIPLVLCTLSSNLAGVSPFKSEHRAGFGAEQRALWERLVGDAQSAHEAGEQERALAFLERAGSLDDRFAMAHFARGQVLLALGRVAEARGAFIRAKEEDIIPLRALEVFNDIVRDVAREQRVPLADVDRRFRDLSPGGITGPPLFLDHVHPDVEGHQLIAREVVEAAVGAGLVPVTPEAWLRARPRALAVLAEERAAVTPRYLAMGRWVIGRTLYWAGKHLEARAPLLEAWRTVRDVGEIPYYLGAFALEEGRPGEAADLFREALAIEPEEPRFRIALARAQIALGEGHAARETLRAVRDPGANLPWHRFALGQAALLVGDVEQALADLREAARLGPGSGEFLAALARAEIAAGREADARETFGRILELRGEAWSNAAWEEFRMLQ